jgi:hypothetical protein
LIASGVFVPLAMARCASHPEPAPFAPIATQALPPSAAPAPSSAPAAPVASAAAPVASAAAPVASAAAPIASASALPPLADPLTPPADLTDPTAREKLAFASTVCAVALKGKRPKLEVGCRECPPFERQEALPDGLLIRDPDPFYPLEVLVRGAFTRAGADEAAAVFSGCESHAENWGGTLLAKREGNAWRAVEYRSGVHPQSCKAFRRPDGRDMLVCRWVDGHQSFWHDRLFSYDFAQPDGSDGAWKPIFELDDNTTGGCFMGVAPGMEVTRGTIDRFEFSDVNHDGHNELIVRVSHAKSAVGPAFHAWCALAQKALEKDKSMPPLGGAAGQTRQHRLVFKLDGEAFVPDRATAAQLASFVPAGP